MKKTTNIEGFGTVTLNDVHMTDGQIEVHIPVATTGQMDEILDKCCDDYMKKHPAADEEKLFIDISVVFSFGGFKEGVLHKSDFMLDIYIWQDKENDEVEIYDEIPLELDNEASKKLKKVIWDGIGKTLFEI